MNAIEIRRLAPSDSLEDLTGMLHRAFAPLGQRGLNCTCVDQTVETTRARVGLGDCYVAVTDGRIVGTLTLHRPDPASPVRHYRAATVASIHQFAVEPGRQGAGVGRALLSTAEQWARHAHYRALALDTPAPALHLRGYYRRRGFEEVASVRLEGRRYRSVILSKPVIAAAGWRRPRASQWPWRHPAEMAALALANEHQRRLRRAATPARPGPASVVPASAAQTRVAR